MYPTHGGRVLFASLTTAFAFLTCSSMPASAQEGDNIEGAVWQFEMTKKGRSPSTVKGQFRMSDHSVYQKENRSAARFDKKVGINKPNGKRTRTEFDNLRAFDADRRPSLHDGVATLKMDGLGEWSGTFTDSDGTNWAMKLSRVKE